MTSNRLESLQCGRAFAAIVVLFFHTNITLALPKYLGHDIFAFANIGYSGVHFFFVLSGFVIYVSHVKDVGNPGKVAGYLKKRFRRVYPLLWIVLLCVIPIFFAIPSFGGGTETEVKNIALSLFALPSLDNNILSVEWTLRHEVIFYLLFAIIIAAPRIGALFMLAWFTVSCVPFEDGTMLSFLFSPYHPLFAMGIAAAVAYRWGPIKFPLATSILGVSIFVGTWVVCLVVGYRGPGPHASPLTEWTFGLGAAFSILGMAWLEKQGRLNSPALLVFLGEASYSIYLVHFPVVSAGAKIVTKYRELLSPHVAYLLVAALALSAGITFHLVVERPIIRRMSRSVRPQLLSQPDREGKVLRQPESAWPAG